MKKRVVILRGNQANPWDLRPWELLADRFDVSVAVAPTNIFQTESLRLKHSRVRTLGSLVPVKQLRGPLTKIVGERYLRLPSLLRGADIVHAAELGYWFSWQAAKLKSRFGYKLVLTVWETIPFLDTYRNMRTRRYREKVLAETDIFLPTTRRAMRALLLEGVSPDRIRVVEPGISLQRFGVARPSVEADSHLVLSIGRLVWEKGHQDVLRAVAELRRSGYPRLCALIVGDGPEWDRLHRYAEELGLRDVVEFKRFIPNDELPAIYARGSCLVLASIPTTFWEEQFGMVLVEAMAAHVPVIAAASGAIPEVVGESAQLFRPGDWIDLAAKLEAGPLSRPPIARRPPQPQRLEHFSADAAAKRLADVYHSLV